MRILNCMFHIIVALTYYEVTAVFVPGPVMKGHAALSAETSWRYPENIPVRLDNRSRRSKILYIFSFRTEKMILMFMMRLFWRNAVFPDPCIHLKQTLCLIALPSVNLVVKLLLRLSKKIVWRLISSLLDEQIMHTAKLFRRNRRFFDVRYLSMVLHASRKTTWDPLAF